MLFIRRADRAIRSVTTTSVVVHGEDPWTATLIPLSVDGMIVASSMALLLDSRYGNWGGLLPWSLLIVGSAASLAANVPVAEPTVVGRLIAAWPPVEPGRRRTRAGECADRR
ncbi:MAG: DUF2637 domain-containing protein [Streptosporangiales bacterium]|nr:DUF2637 domain-containing protein [Streptosporangiales bacterium]